MPTGKRIPRLNSLLREVISEVIQREMRDPRLARFISITEVEITNDLQHAKVFVSILGSDKEREQSMKVLQEAAAFIGIHASKKMVIRHFPELTFYLDTSAEKLLQVDTLLEKIHEEQSTRKPPADRGPSISQ